MDTRTYRQKQLDDLEKLIRDIYQQGYQCGIDSNGEDWFKAYAEAALAITEGEKYTESLVTEMFVEEEIRTAMQVRRKSAAEVCPECGQGGFHKFSRWSKP
jgi:hypothetical protein